MSLLKKKRIETVEQIVDALSSIIPNDLTNDDVVFLCIGTDRSTGDSLAPIIGSLLKNAGHKNVYGTLEHPVHAVNLDDVVSLLPEGKKVIAIDACLGQLSSVGTFLVNKGSMKPGAGVNKNLQAVGDYNIVGIVNVGGFMEYFVLQNTRLHLVMTMAEQIKAAFVHVFPLHNEEVVVKPQTKILRRRVSVS